MAKADCWTVTDAEARKRGEQTGLDTLVVQQAAFATGVPPYIYAFHRYPRNSACLSITQEKQFQMQASG